MQKRNAVNLSAVSKNIDFKRFFYLWKDELTNIVSLYDNGFFHDSTFTKKRLSCLSKIPYRSLIFQDMQYLNCLHRVNRVRYEAGPELDRLMEYCKKAYLKSCTQRGNKVNYKNIKRSIAINGIIKLDRTGYFDYPFNRFEFGELEDFTNTKTVFDELVAARVFKPTDNTYTMFEKDVNFDDAVKFWKEDSWVEKMYAIKSKERDTKKINYGKPKKPQTFHRKSPINQQDKSCVSTDDLAMLTFKFGLEVAVKKGELTDSGHKRILTLLEQVL